MPDPIQTTVPVVIPEDDGSREVIGNATVTSEFNKGVVITIIFDSEDDQAIADAITNGKLVGFDASSLIYIPPVAPQQEEENTDGQQ